MTSAPPIDPAAAGLQQVFPDAPVDAAAPSSARALYRMRLADFRRARSTWIVGWILASVIVPAALATIAGAMLALVALGVLGVLPAAIVLIVQWGRAADAFWDGYARARGLTCREGDVDLGRDTPLLRKGDKRQVHRTLRGRIAGTDARVVQYTYTEVSTDSDGDRTETDYDYLLVMFELPAAVAQRYRGVYLRKGGLNLGALQDKLAHDRAVQLESDEFNKRYDLRVIDEQDDVALYELFSTTFIDRLTTGPVVQWEQVGSSLVVFRKGHAQATPELDELCSAAAAVWHRYREEDR